ncbi:DUF1033 family protein [Sporosarcina sp. HYO08]|uniref:DUF1033 family protein n=1 Tax=Sporosarcina sp. HYO08 TaxID=1759557 RepID=UPI00079C2A0E|nr:DUF1033 family protein [Sporosarcina sp. HYO08]KXH81768.1 hypothetical protein AU377_05745 [Sporosarcina sp. HYO08]
MYEVIYMKADYEPWWMFEDWEEMIRSRQSFHTIEEARSYLEQMLGDFRNQYEHEEMRKNCFYAFWTKTETVYCDGCDDDQQIYHGVILMKDGKPHRIFEQ